jgi:hypothetical protein
MAQQEPAARPTVNGNAKRSPSRTAEIEKWIRRPLAAQRHLAMSFMAVVAVDFERHGAGTLAELRRGNPTNYLRIVASLLPKDLDDENLLDKVSDEELFDVIVQLRAHSAHPGEDRGPGIGPQ